MKNRLVFFILMTAASYAAFSQNEFAQNGVLLETEIKNIESSVNREGISAAQKHESLVHLARLKQLSGDIEGAARNWWEAAGAVPGQVDDNALLSCAYCLAAMGEWDRTIAALQPLLSKFVRARFLDTAVKAIKTADVSALSMLAGNPEFSQMKNEIYFLLWKIQRGENSESWRRRLIAEFPQSPEGRLASGEKPQTIILRPSPFWLFMNIDLPPLSETANQAAVPAAPQPTAIAEPAAAEHEVRVRLQTGIFGRQANAQAQIENLKKAGFSPLLERRVINNNEMWAVTVPAGADVNADISNLRAAGFESFPVR